MDGCGHLAETWMFTAYHYLIFHGQKVSTSYSFPYLSVEELTHHIYSDKQIKYVTLFYKGSLHLDLFHINKHFNQK